MSPYSSSDTGHNRRWLLIAAVAAIAVLSAIAVADSTACDADADTCTVTFVTNDYGTVDRQSVTDVPAGSSFTVYKNTLTVNGVCVTATPNAQDERYTYAFVKWSVHDGDKVTSDTSVTVTFSRSDRYYDVRFMNDGKLYHEQKQTYGEMVLLPAEPTRASDASFNYNFDSWLGYSKHKVVKGDITYTASYVAVLKKYTATDGLVKIEPSDVSKVKIGIGIMDQMVADEKVQRMSVILSAGRIELETAAVGKLTSDILISIGLTDKSKCSEDLAKKIGDSPVYSVTFSGTDGFKGKISVCLKYDLKDGESTSDLSVWYLKDSNSYDAYGCTYSEGYVRFTTDHFSDYAVVHDSGTSGGYDNAVIIAGVVAALIVIAVFAFFMRRKIN